MKMTLKNDKELARLLKKATKKSKEITNAVIKNNIEEGKELAISLAPEDTSFLKDNIVAKHIPNEIEGIIHSQASYSGYVNYGTRFMDARPFFTDAWAETQTKVINDLKDVIGGAYD